MASKKKELILHEGHPWDKENSPWGQEADYYSQKTGEPFSKCRDIIITEYLNNGDPRPLAEILKMGEAPGPGVLRFLAGMMGAPSHEKHLDLPFEVILKGRKGRKPKDRELKWRTFLLNKNVENKISQGKKYEFVAIPEVAELSGLGEQTVRDAYDKYHPRKKPKGK